jgi:hypothetical protein
MIILNRVMSIIAFIKDYVMHLKNVLGTVCACVFASLAAYIKISFVVGSEEAFFSISSMVLPIIGLFGGLGSTTLFLCLKMVSRTLLHGLPAFGAPTLYLPSWCAAWSLTSRHWVIWYLVPLLCITLFLVHPVGGQAWLYSMYWFIPMFVAFFTRHNFFDTALGATFIAHAVGSVIWLYTIPMTAAQWIALIPIVFLERVTYAAGMVVVYHVIQLISNTCAHSLYVKKIRAALIMSPAPKD